MIIKNAGRIIIVKNFDEIFNILKKINNREVKIFIVTSSSNIDRESIERIKELNAEIIPIESKNLVKYMGLRIREKLEKLLQNSKNTKAIFIVDLNSVKNYDYLDKYIFIRSIIYETSRFHNINKTFFVGENRDRRLIEYFTG